MDKILSISFTDCLNLSGLVAWLVFGGYLGYRAACEFCFLIDIFVDKLPTHKSRSSH